ncbi:hypothetical protein B296_00007091 [Ensete ventricosum]|uniref:Uncharacterized protein n=1 Tax=Ensete ventricosum TaxID=4639 RepID=A0A427B1L4_ENSVE|nr:hypothetical protein B296_00007091 [Ensete ventricosum]
MCTAKYGWYIPVCQLTGMRTAYYRAVPPKEVAEEKPGVLFAREIHRPKAISSPHTGRRNVSPREEKERGNYSLCIPLNTEYHTVSYWYAGTDRYNNPWIY